MTSIEDKLRELGIDPEWQLCEGGGLQDLRCEQYGVWCPVNGCDIACYGSIIARLIDMVEGMRRCENCDYCGSPAYAEPCLSCDDHCSNWRYWEST